MANKKVPERVIEGGAIKDDGDMTMEAYSDAVKKRLGKEYRQFVDDIITKFNIPEVARVLEIGPGPGWIGIWLAQRRPDLQIVGIELSKDMIRVAEANASAAGVANVSYINSGVEDMRDVEDGTCDLVFSNGSLHHWTDPVAAFKEIARVLKPSGKVFIRDNRRDLTAGGKFIVNVLGRFVAGKMWKGWKTSIAAGYIPDEVTELFSQAGVEGWNVITNFMDLSIENQVP